MNPEQESQVEYEAPAVIYEGKLTTRAGSPLRDSKDVFDPGLLFGQDE